MSVRAQHQGPPVFSEHHVRRARRWLWQEHGNHSYVNLFARRSFVRGTQSQCRETPFDDSAVVVSLYSGRPPDIHVSTLLRCGRSVSRHPLSSGRKASAYESDPSALWAIDLIGPSLARRLLLHTLATSAVGRRIGESPARSCMHSSN